MPGRRSMNVRGAWLLLLASLVGCHQPTPRQHLSDSLPATLDGWQQVQVKDRRLIIDERVMEYDLNTPLFSDYAHKLRTISVPAGTRIHYGVDEFVFPVGTVITKTFYYPRGDGPDRVRKVTSSSQRTSLDLSEFRLLETRVLVNTASGWVAAPYVWNAEQTQATLELAGSSFSLELIDDRRAEAFEYMVPDANQCAGCHAADHARQILKPIGVKARHLNRDYPRSAQNQLRIWQSLGLLRGLPQQERLPRNVQWDSPAHGLDARARAYLDVNCGHCHSTGAAANTTGLALDAAEMDPIRLGICKIPVASGRGSGAASFDIVPGAPDDSILVYRMESTELDVAMPELGRALIHREGVALIREWIASLPGGCPAP